MTVNHVKGNPRGHVMLYASVPVAGARKPRAS